MTPSLALQIIGTAAAIIGAVLIVKRHLGCWPVLIASNIIFLVVYIDARLYAAIPQLVAFMAVNAWGWREWGRGK